MLNILNLFPYKKAWHELFFFDNEADLQKKILTELINTIKNLPAQTSSITFSPQFLPADQAFDNIVKALNRLQKCVSNKNLFKTVAITVIYAQKLPIIFDKTTDSFQLTLQGKQLIKSQQFEMQYKTTTQQAIQDINNFLKKNVSEETTSDNILKEFIEEVINNDVEKLNDDSFLALYNSDLLKDDLVKKLKINFFALQKNEKKYIYYNEDDNKWVLVESDFAPIYNNISEDQKKLLKSINCFDTPQQKNVNEKYNNIYRTIKEAKVFKDTLEGLQQTLIDRSSKIGITPNNFDRKLCTEFLTIFQQKLNVYIKKRFVFGIVNFIEHVLNDYFNNITINNSTKELDFLSILEKDFFKKSDEEVKAFINGIQNPNKEYTDLKSAFINGLDAYVNYIKNTFGQGNVFSIDYDSDNNLIKKLCNFLQYNINDINIFLKEVCKKNNNVAQVIFDAYQHYKKNTLNVLLQLDDSKTYYQIVDTSNKVGPQSEKKSFIPQQNKKPTQNNRAAAGNIVPTNRQTENLEGQVENTKPKIDADPDSNRGLPNTSFDSEPKKEEPNNAPKTSGGGFSIWSMLSTIGSFIVWPFKAIYNFFFGE